MTRKKWYWLGFGLISLLLRWLVGFGPGLTEQVYSRGLYQGVRACWQVLWGWLPFPAMYLVVFAFVGWLIVRSIRWWRWHAPFGKKAWSALTFVLALLAGIVGSFMWLWGFNYARVSVERQMELEVKPLAADDLWAMLAQHTDTLIEMRSKITADTAALSAAFFPENQEKLLRAGLRTALREANYPAGLTVRGRQVGPKGIYLRFSSSGMYFPFTGEGTYDGGLHPLQVPYVLAHEMGHGYGFGDEGTCNFWGFLGTRAAEDPVLQYAGRLSFWRTLAVNCLRYDRDRYRALRADLPRGIINDLDAINKTLNDYPDIMPRLRYQAYNAYLQSQGISEGMENYNRVLMLVAAWEKR